MDFYIIQYKKCLDTYHNLCLNLTFRGCKYMPKTKKYMVIVESPAKAKTIGKYLGSSYFVRSSMGHVRDLPERKLSVY